MISCTYTHPNGTMMSHYHITNTGTDDLSLIYKLFEEAILFQERNHYKGWSNYDKDFIQSDIKKGLSYKIVTNGQVICIFSICYSDALIWNQKEKGDAIYLHRIVSNQQFKGERVFQQILDWVIQLALERNLKYIRMDTWAANERLISYYKSYGFLFIENYTTPNTDNLPVQHRNLDVALLELSIPAVSQSKPAKMEKISGDGKNK